MFLCGCGAWFIPPSSVWFDGFLGRNTHSPLMSIPSQVSSTDVDERAEVLFFQALKQPEDERQAFLADACGGNETLRAEVDALLQDHDKAGGFLKIDAPVSAEQQAEFARLKPEDRGERIGNYKLLEKIGEGGFGVVWVAEQEKPVRRRVALKIIKLGMDTRDVVARFEQERQALAMMDQRQTITQNP
jgi:hypothetical protein